MKSATSCDTPTDGECGDSAKWECVAAGVVDSISEGRERLEAPCREFCSASVLSIENKLCSPTRNRISEYFEFIRQSSLSHATSEGSC